MKKIIFLWLFLFCSTFFCACEFLPVGEKVQNRAKQNMYKYYLDDANYNWYIGTVPGQMKLLISDNPAQGIMLGFNDICIPLCGDKAIIFRIANPDAPILSKDMPVGDEIVLSERSVFAYNAVQLSYANRFVFGDKMSLAILKAISENQGQIHDMMEIKRNN